MLAELLELLLYIWDELDCACPHTLLHLTDLATSIPFSQTCALSAIQLGTARLGGWGLHKQIPCVYSVGTHVTQHYHMYHCVYIGEGSGEPPAPFIPSSVLLLVCFGANFPGCLSLLTVAQRLECKQQEIEAFLYRFYNTLVATVSECCPRIH